MWVNGFKKLWVDSDMHDECYWHMTYQSLDQKSQKIFGYRNKYFNKMFYMYLADGDESK